MFVFLTDRFGGRRVKIPSKITEFTVFWPETGTGRKLGNTLYACFSNHYKIKKSNKLISVLELGTVETGTELGRPARIEPKPAGNKRVFLYYHSFECTLRDALTAKLVAYISLTNRVRGSYRKLRSEDFPLRFMAQAQSARAINRRPGKNEDP